eukprot:5687349-Pleurochrysis_carterae.AAC.1
MSSQHLTFRGVESMVVGERWARPSFCTLHPWGPNGRGCRYGNQRGYSLYVSSGSNLSRLALSACGCAGVGRENSVARLASPKP